MKRYLIGIILVAVLTAVALISVRIITGEDSWICVDGQWAKHGYPVAPKPTTGCAPEDSAKTTTEPQINRKITGKFEYPPGYEPIDMTVCAKRLDNDRNYCTFFPAEKTRGLPEIEYEINLFPGSYYVFAYDYNDNSTVSFYTDYVKCGMTEECTSHEYLTVIVPQHADVTGINPIDWNEYEMIKKSNEEDISYEAANPITPDDVDKGLPAD